MSKFIPAGTLQAFDDEDEIELYESTQERRLYDNFADLYAIIMTTESLEKSYARNAVTRDEVCSELGFGLFLIYFSVCFSFEVCFYPLNNIFNFTLFHFNKCFLHRLFLSLSHQKYVSECNKLISQFRVAEKLALEKKPMNAEALDKSTETFMQIYQMDCPLAYHRLLVAGVPETMSTVDTNIGSSITVAETTEHFITIMDALKLNTTAVDELQPLLSDLMNKLTRLPETPNDFEPNRIVQQWLQKLNLMRAIDDIDEADSRQLYMDLDSAYQEFKKYLDGKN